MKAAACLEIRAWSASRCKHHLEPELLSLEERLRRLPAPRDDLSWTRGDCTNSSLASAWLSAGGLRYQQLQCEHRRARPFLTPVRSPETLVTSSSSATPATFDPTPTIWQASTGSTTTTASTPRTTGIIPTQVDTQPRPAFHDGLPHVPSSDTTSSRALFTAVDHNTSQLRNPVTAAGTLNPASLDLPFNGQHRSISMAFSVSRSRMVFPAAECPEHVLHLATASRFRLRPSRRRKDSLPWRIRYLLRTSTRQRCVQRGAEPAVRLPAIGHQCLFFQPKYQRYNRSNNKSGIPIDSDQSPVQICASRDRPHFSLGVQRQPALVGRRGDPVRRLPRLETRTMTGPSTPALPLDRGRTTPLSPVRPAREAWPTASLNANLYRNPPWR